MNQEIRQEAYVECLKLKTKKGEEIELLNNIANSIYDGDDATTRKHLVDYANKSEENFIKGKALSLYCNNLTSRDVPTHQYAGDCETIYARMSREDNVYSFVVPPLHAKRNSDRYKSEGKHTFYILRKLIEDYEKDKKIFIESFNNPIIVFEHHINRSSGLDKLMDADNIDTKAAIDALNGTLYTDDNILALKHLHVGVLDSKSFCKIYVMEGEFFPEWLSNNSKLFATKQG